jgi:hypothetical protein
MPRKSLSHQPKKNFSDFTGRKRVLQEDNDETEREAPVVSTSNSTEYEVDDILVSKFIY